jgi:hypothetical protein
MKRSIAVAAIALTIAFGVYSQSLDTFKTAFEGFAGDMAGTLTVNSTIGSNWSDAYVGAFPHFGVGVAAGAAFISPDTSKTLFDAMGASMPSALSKVGIPIPAAVATLKIGLPFLPMDVGIKGGYISPSVGKSLMGSSGGSVDYTNFGIQLRYALVKQSLVLPNVSIGASYNYQKGSVSAPSGLGSQTFNVQTDKGTTDITASDPAVALGWTSNTVDFTAQVSKKFLFIVPYLGTGLTVGKSSVTGGVSSTLSSTYSSGTYGSGITGLNNYFAANGGPTISDQGFTYSADKTGPIFRIYGGLSFRIIIIDIDAQAMYVPAGKAFGASLTGRVQI